MVAPNASTYDLVPPIRPGTETFNGIAKVDDENESPDPQTMPNAAEWNTIEWLTLGVDRVTPVARFSCTGSTGAITGYGGKPKGPAIGSFTPTHVGAGVNEITWPANTFPASTMKPDSSLNGGPGSVWAENITNGVRIHTYDPAGAAANLDFSVSVY